MIDRVALTHRILRPVVDRRALRRWERSAPGTPPPSVVKQRIVREYARAHNLRTLVETGTYMGDMIRRTRAEFDTIHSIELDDTLYRRARSQFRSDRAITIHHGDSASVLPGLLETIDEPCLFWLDAHYSFGITAKGALNTPIEGELATIFAHRVRDHVILIDDARCFIGQDDYPEVEKIREIVAEHRPGWNVSVEQDVIRIHAPAMDREPALA